MLQLLEIKVGIWYNTEIIVHEKLQPKDLKSLKLNFRIVNGKCSSIFYNLKRELVENWEKTESINYSEKLNFSQIKPKFWFILKS